MQESVGQDIWLTGEPGEPKGDLSKYRHLVAGPRPQNHWNSEIDTALGKWFPIISGRLPLRNEQK